MKVPGAAELESRKNQQETDIINLEQEEPGKGTGHSQAPRDPPLVLQCSTAKATEHTHVDTSLSISAGLPFPVKMEFHIQGK